MKAAMLAARKAAATPKGGIEEQPNGSQSQINGLDSSPTMNGHTRTKHASSGKPLNGKKRKKSPSLSPVSDADSDSEDNIPLAAASSSPLKSGTRKILYSDPPTPIEEQSSDDEDNRPLASSSPAKQVASAAIPMSRANGAANGRKIQRVSYKEDSSDDDEVPLSQTSRNPVPPGSSANSTPVKKPPRKRAKVVKDESESEDDMPLSSALSSPQKQSLGNVVSTEEEGDAISEAATPQAKKGRKKAAPKAKNVIPAKRKAKEAKKESDEEPLATPRKKPTKNGKEKEVKAEGSPRKKAKKEAEEEDIFKWWEANGEEGEGAGEVKEDGSVKWNSLVHNGVMFPPPYQPLPSNIKFQYDGRNVDLPPESEEVASFFAKLLGGPHVQDPVFQKNFFRDFTSVCKQYPARDGTKIHEFSKCNFNKIYDHIMAEKEKKKNWTKDQKKADKEKVLAEEEKFKTCTLDGRKEKVGNFRVEPPGLFLGRGEHPKKGSLKLRLRPEDIVLNIGEGVPVPVPNMPGKWKSVVHDNTVTWLANWKENINGNFKYVFLAASSSLKGQSDMMKFEKARELKKHVDRIRLDYNSDLKGKVMADRQRATAMYFIDKLALRAGNEKGEDEADTVGCCSLRCEHVTLDPPNKLVFDFLGKDSIRYYNTVEVDLQVFKNVRIFKKDKEDDDALFDRVSTTLLNKHLQSYMKGLTAKVFRTYNASWTLQEQLDKTTPENASVAEKLAAYNKANRMVAVLCNHQRSVSKGHGDSMAKMSDKLRGLKYERMKLRHVLFGQEPKKKKSAQYTELESDLDDEFIERWEGVLKERDVEKAKKKFAKDNEKLEAEGGQPQEKNVLEAAISAIEEEYERLESERGTEEAVLKRSKTTEKLEESIDALDTKIKNFKLQMEDKEEGKEVSLGTSKINYLDPRITAAWCEKHEVPITKIFAKSLIQKFPWAMGAKADWRF